MGKQTAFFATPADLLPIFQDVYKKGASILDEYGLELDMKEVLDRCNSCFTGELYGCNLFIILDSSRIGFVKNNATQRIDQAKAEAIVFHPCTRQEKYLLDTSVVDNQFKKGDYIVIDNTIKYEQLMAEYMKHPVYRKNPNYIEGGVRHARFWFAPTYYDDRGEIVKKSKQICDMYLFLRNYVKTNYKLSTDGFGYIGIDAYEQYCLGDFVPCSGNIRIEF